MVEIPHTFEHGGERTVIAFTKNPEEAEQLRSVGVQLAGGEELIKEIQNGNINLKEFQYVLAHPTILPEIVVLRGLLRTRFPNIKLGTLEVDLAKAAKRFLYGIRYSAVKDEYEKDFGLVETQIGTVSTFECIDMTRDMFLLA